MLTIVENYVREEIKKAAIQVSETVMNKYFEYLKKNQIVVSDITNIVSNFRGWYIHNYY